jgi:hypothetical protein
VIQLANYTDEQLREILLSPGCLEFLEQHPSYYHRAAKIYKALSTEYRKKAYAYDLERALEKASRFLEALNKSPEY